MNFEGFEVVENSHPRKGGYTLVKEQVYENMKYRVAPKKVKGKDDAVSLKMEGRFFISNARVKELGLGDDGTNGLLQLTNPQTGATMLCVVADEHAEILKKSKKGKKSKNFNSPKLEAALERLLLIDPKLEKVSQYLDLTPVELSPGAIVKGIPVLKAFTFSKGIAKAPVAKETVAETATPTAAPVAQGQPQAAAGAAPAAKGEWD